MRLNWFNFRKISMRNRIFTAMMILTMCICFLVIFIVKNLLPPALVEASKDTGILTAKSLALHSFDDIVTENCAAIRSRINEAKEINNKIEYIFVMDESFNILSHTFSDGFPMALRTLNNDDSRNGGAVMLLDTEEGGIYDIVAPVKANGDTLGYVRVGLSDKNIQDLCDRTVAAVLWAGLSSVLLASYLSFLLAEAIAGPVEAIHRASEDIMMGDFSGRVRTPPVPCWEFTQCGEKDCPVFGNNDLPCWCTSGTLFFDEIRGKDYAEKIDYCRTCPVYRKYSGDAVQQLAETFNLLTRRLNNKFSELARSRQQYKELFDSAPISLWREDISLVRKRIDSLRAEGVSDFEKYWKEHPGRVRECAGLVKVLDVNKATLEMYGAKNKNDFLKNSPSVFTEESYKGIARLLTAISGGAVYSEMEGVSSTLTGEKLNVIIKWILYGKSKLIFAVQDITSQKKTEEDLRVYNVMNRLLFEASMDAIMTLESPSWRFTSGNSAAVKLFGVKDEKEFVSHTPWEYSPKYQPDGQLSQDKAGKMIDQALKEGTNFFEWTHKKLNGPDFYATVSLTRASIGDRIFVQAVVKDITERKNTFEEMIKKEKKLMHALSVKSKFSAMVSHELRTPLTAIKEGLDLIRHDAKLKLSVEHKKLLSIVKRNVDRLHRMINDVLDFSKLQSGRMELTFKKNDKGFGEGHRLRTEEKTTGYCVSAVCSAANAVIP